MLLSRGFIEAYQRFGRFNGDNNFSIIPNSLSFNEFLPVDKIKEKQPVVLIVSRIEEVHKRLSLALKIWAKSKERNRCQWMAVENVGTGTDLPKYRQMIKNEKIPNVTFEGRQNSHPVLP